jgi:hypothetical protein
MSKAVIICSAPCAELYNPDEWRDATVYVVNEMAAKVADYDYASFLDLITQQKVLDKFGVKIHPRRGVIVTDNVEELAPKGKCPGLEAPPDCEYVCLHRDLKPTKHTFWQNWSFTTAVYVAVTVHGHDEIHLFGVDHEGTGNGFDGIPKKAAWNETRWNQERRNYKSTLGQFQTTHPHVTIIRHLPDGDRVDQMGRGHTLDDYSAALPPDEGRLEIDLPPPVPHQSVELLGLSKRCVRSLMENNITNCHRLLAVVSGPNGIEELIDRVWGINKKNIDEVIARAKVVEGVDQ